MFDEIFKELETNNSYSMSMESVLTPEMEAAIFLAAMEEECTPEEFHELVTESAIDLEIYKIIPNADDVSAAMEAGYNKKVVTKQTKATVFNKVHKRACLRLAEADDGPLWKKYKKHRTAMIEAREEIYRKYSSKAKTVAKKSMSNSAKKASAMQTQKGNDIVAKMDKQIEKLNKSN